MRGRTGPKPTPTNLRQLRGDPGKRKKKPAEPQPDPASTEAPDWLEEIGREMWTELAPELHRLGLLTTLDRQALAGACRWWAVYRKADEKLKGELTHKTKANGMQPVPEFKVAREAFTAAMTVLGRFGVTPSERTRLVAMGQHDNDDDTFEKLLQRREQAATRSA